MLGSSSSKWFQFSVAAAAAVVTLGGCAVEAAEGDADALGGASADELRRGRLSSARPEVGKFLRLNEAGDQYTAICTATLVSRQTLLTAAHCVDYGNDGVGGRALGHFVIEGVAKTTVHAWDGYRSFGQTVGPDDVAIVHLTHPVPSSVARPVPIAAGLPDEDETVVLYGYGAHDCDTRGTVRAWDAQKRQFAFEWGNDPEALCPGDSGGPTFAGGSIVQVSSAIASWRRFRFFGAWRREDRFGYPTRHLSAIHRQIAAWER